MVCVLNIVSHTPLWNPIRGVAIGVLKLLFSLSLVSFGAIVPFPVSSPASPLEHACVQAFTHGMAQSVSF